MEQVWTESHNWMKEKSRVNAVKVRRNRALFSFHSTSSFFGLMLFSHSSEIIDYIYIFTTIWYIRSSRVVMCFFCSHSLFLYFLQILLLYVLLCLVVSMNIAINYEYVTMHNINLWFWTLFNENLYFWMNKMKTFERSDSN